MQNVHGPELQLDHLRKLLNPGVETAEVEYLYSNSVEGDRRWSNLIAYLRFMQNIQPDILLIGEAPGYRGTAVSGVPFLSEGMIKHRKSQGLLLPITVYNKSTNYDEVSGYEATSSVMWNVLDNFKTSKLPLLWAVFPNHPHASGDEMSNRRPAKHEVAAYSGVIALLLEMYPIRHIVAIGNVAYDTLDSNIQYPVVKLRHPARGGAKKFREGFNGFMEGLNGHRT